MAGVVDIGACACNRQTVFSSWGAYVRALTASRPLLYLHQKRKFSFDVSSSTTRSTASTEGRLRPRPHLLALTSGMTQELVSPGNFSEAQGSIQAGGDGVRDGVAVVLIGIMDYRQNGCSGGVDSVQILNAAMRRLVEDPYLTLGVEPDGDEGAIKRAYRKLALRYHPDKNKATTKLFQVVQGAYVSGSIYSCWDFGRVGISCAMVRSQIVN